VLPAASARVKRPVSASERRTAGTSSSVAAEASQSQRQPPARPARAGATVTATLAPTWMAPAVASSTIWSSA
jgi:hypothetical protein